MMTCLEVSSLLAEHSLASLPADRRALVETHLSQCAGCRGLVESINGITRMSVPQSLFTPEDVAPVRPMPARAWFLAVAFVVPVVLATIGVLCKGAYGWGALSLESILMYSILAVAAMGALTLGFYRQFKPGARDTVDGRAAMAVLVLGFVAFVSVEFGWHPEPDFDLSSALACFSFGLMVALGASLPLLSWARLGFAPNPRSASFWTGALASMAGMIALAIHCPYLELSHMLLGHASVIVVATCLVAFAARRLFGVR